MRLQNNRTYAKTINGVKLIVDFKNNTIRLNRKNGAIIEQFNPKVKASKFYELLNDFAEEFGLNGSREEVLSENS